VWKGFYRLWFWLQSQLDPGERADGNSLYFKRYEFFRIRIAQQSA
jgi:hypothetical protein